MINAFGRLILAGLIVASPGLATGQDSLALKRVTLSSGGVGYFEYETTIDGDTEILLPVWLDQVDDVLKSLVIRDTKGIAATLRLAGRKPLGQIFHNLPIDQGALESPCKRPGGVGLQRASAQGRFVLNSSRSIASASLRTREERSSSRGLTFVEV